MGTGHLANKVKVRWHRIKPLLFKIGHDLHLNNLCCLRDAHVSRLWDITEQKTFVTNSIIHFLKFFRKWSDIAWIFPSDLDLLNHLWHDKGFIFSLVDCAMVNVHNHFLLQPKSLQNASLNSYYLRYGSIQTVCECGWQTRNKQSLPPNPSLLKNKFNTKDHLCHQIFPIWNKHDLSLHHNLTHNSQNACQINGLKQHLRQKQLLIEWLRNMRQDKVFGAFERVAVDISILFLLESAWKLIMFE